MPTDINDRIAKAKGYSQAQVRCGARPDFTGTLEGVAGMLRELNEKSRKDRQYWWWGQNAYGLVDAPRDAFICVRHGVAEHTLFLVPWFWSPPDRPGDCAGEALLSVLGKEVVDASSE